ncbi:triose-phosphate isomerase [Gloeobacter kilaueensis]|uniref:Triosephosphate isomerase n=1 Tax=Gloeobacter kilaueensis (strain ATCC BAA-2537 / CCAP 1431/1 / ULC 316 / JS1) TaxID=1183438 RepID=U5QMQ9_GLOK1|nr:triose-phosphate isomerase [Gloeobacter kilaueensis]AGY60206.1 triosephosphate isomerase [Gloeobacter kilaueensis JS1]
MARKVLAGNWKMHKTRGEARAFVEAFLPLIEPLAADRLVILCGPYTCLDILSANAGPYAVGAQNVHWENSGAYTGEIAPVMLTELGVLYAIVGHSERRQYFNETDATVNRRLKAAQAHDLTPILCVGESEALRLAGQTESHIRFQLDHDLKDIDLDRLIVAYEPIWAIGTGKTCAPVEANRIIGLIREHVGQANLPVLYGGSCNPGNIDAIMAQDKIDGVLVGGASLEVQSFARIVNFEAVAVTS